MRLAASTSEGVSLGDMQLSREGILRLAVSTGERVLRLAPSTGEVALRLAASGIEGVLRLSPWTVN